MRIDPTVSLETMKVKELKQIANYLHSMHKTAAKLIIVIRPYIRPEKEAEVLRTLHNLGKIKKEANDLINEILKVKRRE